MDRIERDRLYLMWLSCKDFNSLSLEENQSRFKYVWRRIKTQMEPYFKTCAISINSIMKTFEKIHITIDPKQPCGYDPQKHALVFNIWSLFFSPVQDQYCIPSPPFKTGGQFVHEFDHYCYLKEHDMLGKTKKEYDEFDRTNLRQLERRAFLSQINFFVKCRENLPYALNSYQIKIMKWTKGGKPMEQKLKEFTFEREQSLKIIDGMISDLNEVMERIDKGEEYNRMCTENTIDDMKRIVELLALPIGLDQNKQDYQSVTIEI